MSEKIKNLLGAAVVITIIILAVSAASYVYSYSAYVKSMKPSSFRSFSVSAESKITIVPDIAQFSFSVITEGGKDIAQLQKENTEKANKIINSVKAEGVQAIDIKTQNYNITPRYQYFSCPQAGGACPPPEIVGYSVNQTVLVKIRDFNKIGTLLSMATTNGANSVSELSFTIDDPTNYQNQARAEAISKAKKKALDIAKAGDFRLGRLLSIQEGGAYPSYQYDLEARGIGGGKEVSAPAPVIEPGSQEVRITMTLQYEIE